MARYLIMDNQATTTGEKGVLHTVACRYRYLPKQVEQRETDRVRRRYEVTR